MAKSISLNVIIPHKNIIFDLKQLQKYFLNTPEGKDFFPFFPFFAPLCQSLFSNKILPPLYFHEPQLNNSWLYVPLSFTEENDKIITEDFKIAELPSFPKYFSIPLAFTLKKDNKLNEEKNFLFDSINGSYGKLVFPIKARIFRTAKINFSWPLEKNSIAEIQKKYSETIPENLPYAFNWTLSENKWKK